MSETKRILSIDGGGIRGIIAVQTLVEIEYYLKKYYNDEDYKLCYFFDLIAGTSTGSIIAAGLAKGMAAEDILKLYVKNGESIFKKTCIAKAFTGLEKRGESLSTLEKSSRLLAKLAWLGRLIVSLAKLGKVFAIPKYNSLNLENLLKEEFEDMRLSSDKLETKLLIVTRNITQGESWSFCNHDANKHYELNKDIKISDLVRASCAAPTLFDPHQIEINREHNIPHDPHQIEIIKEINTFVDGAIGMNNNPSYQALLEATKSPSDGGLGWEKASISF